MVYRSGLDSLLRQTDARGRADRKVAWDLLFWTTGYISQRVAFPE